MTGTTKAPKATAGKSSESSTGNKDTTTTPVRNSTEITPSTTNPAPDTELAALCRDILTRPAVLANIRRKYRYRQNQRLELSRKVRKMEQDMARRVEEEFLKTKDPRLSNADKRRLETGRRLEETPRYQNLVNQKEELQTVLYTLEDDLAAGREALRAEIAVITSLSPAPVIVSGIAGVTPEKIHESGQLIVPDLTTPKTPEEHPCHA